MVITGLQTQHRLLPPFCHGSGQGLGAQQVDELV